MFLWQQHTTFKQIVQLFGVPRSKFFPRQVRRGPESLQPHSQILDELVDHSHGRSTAPDSEQVIARDSILEQQDIARELPSIEAAGHEQAQQNPEKNSLTDFIDGPRTNSCASKNGKQSRGYHDPSNRNVSHMSWRRRQPLEWEVDLCGAKEAAFANCQIIFYSDPHGTERRASLHEFKTLHGASFVEEIDRHDVVDRL